MTVQLQSLMLHGIFAAMRPVHELQNQLEKIDMQIIHLLRERIHFYWILKGQGDNESFEEEIVLLWIEEALDQGMDEEIVEKIAQLVMQLSRKGEE